MQTERVLLLLLVLVAIAGGVFWLVGEESRSAQEADQARADAERAAEEQMRAAEDAERRRGSGTGGAALDDAFRQRLTELGFPGDLQVSESQALILGRVMGRTPVPEAEETTEDVPFEPVAGARIALHRVGDDGVAEETAETEAIARNDGWFLVTVSRTWGWQLGFSADGFHPETRDLARTSLAEGASDIGEVRLERVCSVTVVVTTGLAELGETVEPVPGMDVVVHGSDPETPLAKAQTDKDGKALLTGLPTDTLNFTGTLDPYAAFSQGEKVLRDGQVIEVNVDAVGRVRLKVTTPGGAAVSAFSAALDFQHATYGYREPQFADLEAGDDGWAVVEGVKAGEYVVYATAKGWALGTQDKIGVSAGATTDVTIALPHGFPVRGRVVAKGSGRPVSRAVVFSENDLIPSTVATHTRDGFRPTARATFSADDGTFELEDLTAGVHKITATHTEYAAKSVETVRVGEDGAAEFTIELPLGATLSGHVHDKDGQPQGGARILVIDFRDSRNTKKKPPLMALTDKDGAYRIEHVPAGMAGVIQTFDRPVEGQPPFSMKTATFREGASVVVDFGTAAKGAVVRGHVTDPNGQPVTGFTVMLMSSSAILEGDIPDFHQGATKPDGSYEIKGVPGGDYTVALAKTLKASDFANVDSLKVPASGSVVKDLVVRGGAVRGTVLSKQSGKGLDGGEVTLMSSNNTFAGHLMVGPGGAYEFPVVTPGTYFVVARADEHVVGGTDNVVVLDGQDTQVPPIRLSPGGRIVGVVKDGDGQPVEGAQIVLKDPQGNTEPAWAFRSAEDGSFAAESVPVGTYSVSATKTGQTFDETPVTVTQGGVTQVTIHGN